jgi:hypothetical protein
MPTSNDKPRGVKDMNKISLPFAIFSILGSSLYAYVVSADNAWGKYHWDLSTQQSTADPLDLGDNLSTAEWNNSLDIASLDWNNSVLKNEIGPGISNANCDPSPGRVEVCNGEYGLNGWLGIASIWATRGKNNHITQATTRVNDSYFKTAPYHSQAWRDFVMCQEVGHVFGLDHQDENFSNVNLGTCMDYTDDPDGTINGELDNRHPNQHDYDMLTEIYSHLNSSGNGGGGNGNGNGNGRGEKPNQSNPGDNRSPNNPSEWGQAVSQDAQGRNSLFVRSLSNDRVLITHVLWAY